MFRLLIVALTAVASPAMALEMPAEYMGGWGSSAAACAGGPGSEGYLEITATELRFYESVATLVAYETIDEPGLMFDFQFSGEGEVWTESMYLEVQDDGSTLFRIDMGEPRGIPLAYIACN